MKDFIRVMKALSDPGRVKIVKMLQTKELCVCELTAVLKLAQPTVSKHLKILEDAGLVEQRKEGPWVNYKIIQGDTSEYAAAMLKYLGGWLAEDAGVREALQKAKTVDRGRICAA
jgi:ArsR family transcriptional regulator